MTVTRIISGGQTGADRGGLEAAIALGIPHGGYCPRGRLAEDGAVPFKYDLTETASAGYPDRTLRNIAEADGTIVFIESMASAGPGSRLTINTALKVRRPVLTIEMSQSRKVAASRIRSWLRRYKIETLNVAGSRESKSPGLEEAVKELLMAVLR
jgi:hypothetical protein